MIETAKHTGGNWRGPLAWLNEAMKSTAKHDTTEDDWQHFYRAFEDRFRGSAEQIFDRLSSRYRARLRRLSKELTTAPRAIDLGCGRGEMIKLMEDCGFCSTGVDASPKMLAGNFSRAGSKVVSSDLLSYLKEQPDRCAEFISLIHVVEHCPPKVVFQVFQQAYRCLNKSGVLLVETPSALSLWASTRQFCLDPTHQNPVHPDYLSFMSEYLNFSRCELLQFDKPAQPEVPTISSDADPTLRSMDSWLYGELDIAAWITK